MRATQLKSNPGGKEVRTALGSVAACLLLATAGNGLAATHYVDLNSANPAPPYTDWATAATNIQNAVDAAAAGDEIVVTNGTYATGGRSLDGETTNRVGVGKPLALRSVNGPEVTVVDGAGLRCVYLCNGASLSGFTLAYGRASSGGGVWCESATAVVSNCCIAGNSALGYFVAGGGAYSGTLNNCTLSGNSAFYGGGACASILNNCTVSGNSAPYDDGDTTYGGYGGGAYECTLNASVVNSNSAYYGGGVCYSTLTNCVLAGNAALADLYYGLGGDGGGAYASTLRGCTLTGNSARGQPFATAQGGAAFDSVLVECTLTANSADVVGGGVCSSTLHNCNVSGNSAGIGGGGYLCTMDNCALTGNSALYDTNTLSGGFGGGTYAGSLSNCTLTGNSADVGGGGATAFPGDTCRLNNCILFSNTAPIGPNFDTNDTSCILNYCCTAPMPANGFGNITNAPLFVDLAGGNLRLQSNSPCINAGNNAYAPAGPDLDANPRIVGGTVDIGAYEFQNPASIISYAWLQQYGLSTDGSADFTDPDGDGMNNWQEWRCGTDPTSALSALRLLPPVVTRTNVMVTWQSVAGVNYFLERSTSLVPPVVFAPMAANILGQANRTTYADTNAPGSGPFFYRVGVR
jgi:hypothetical protein